MSRKVSVKIKRVVDVVISSAMLLTLSPIMALIALSVITGSKGGAIYRQRRVGRGRREFIILKFRTMSEDAEKEGPQLSRPGDERITRQGRWLRKYHLDELPQLWNVLKGDMSMVGPRPERACFLEEMLRLEPECERFFSVRPGITCWGVVRYGYASDVAQMVERSRYDLEYLRNPTITADFRILVSTVGTVLRGRGI